jgi:uncharacterized membrane protein YphA (DoxX/SURF4 family)
MKLLQNRWVVDALRWALAAGFVYAGGKKMLEPANFSDSIASFALLPAGLIPWVALGLPPFEILLGLCVASGFQRRAALLGLTGLLVVFLLALGSAVVRGIPIDCGCFGSGTPSASDAWIAFGRDLLILAVAVALYREEAKR